MARAGHGTLPTQTSAWSSFTLGERQETTYESTRPVRTTLSGGSGPTTYAITQYSYDTVGRLECNTVRMNPSIFGSTLPGACSLGTQGLNGPDRITRNTYTAAYQLSTVTVGYGTSGAVTAATLTYTNNGLRATLADGRGSLTTYEYDAFDRPLKIRYPNSSSSGSSTGDYDQWSYDDSGGSPTHRMTSFRRRDGNSIGYSYDNLGRVTTLNLPGSDPDVTYTYDLLSRPLTATVGSRTITNTYNGLSQVTSVVDGLLGTVSYQYDEAGNRTRITWPDGSPNFYVRYHYDNTGAVTYVRENGASSGTGLLATLSYNNLGYRTQISRAGTSGATTTYSYDDVARLSSLTQNLSGTSNDVTLGFTYNAAGQVLVRSVSNTSYLTSPSSSSTSYSVNNLNQYTAVGGTSQNYDSRANLTGDTSRTLAYDSLNRLTSASAPTSATLAYDPYGRLGSSNASSTETRYLYDGDTLIAELNTSGTVLHRYVPGPGQDETLVWYEGSGTSTPHWLQADNLGTVIADSDSSGAVGTIYNYSLNGVPTSWSGSRMRYTGQPTIPEANLYYYRARAYDPGLGRFLQPDPIGAQGGLNLYAYAENDPVNSSDPSGLTPGAGTTPPRVFPLEGVCVGGGCPGEGGMPRERMPSPAELSGTRGGGWGGGGDFYQSAPAPAALNRAACPVVEPGTITDGVGPRPGDLISGAIAYAAATDTIAATRERYLNTGLRGEDDERDAWRHFCWSYEMTQRMGPSLAQRWANQHEIDKPNGPASARMDLHNNAMARAFATSYYGLRRSPSEAADLALSMGCLQTQP